MANGDMVMKAGLANPVKLLPVFTGQKAPVTATLSERPRGDAADEGHDPVGGDELRHVADAFEDLEIEAGNPVLHRQPVRLVRQHAVGRAEQDAGRHPDLAIALGEPLHVLAERDEVARRRVEMARPQP